MEVADERYMSVDSVHGTVPKLCPAGRDTNFVCLMASCLSYFVTENVPVGPNKKVSS